MKPKPKPKKMSRWGSAGLNLNTARNYWMDAVSALLQANKKECLVSIDACIKQLKSARWKLEELKRALTT